MTIDFSITSNGSPAIYRRIGGDLHQLINRRHLGKISDYGWLIEYADFPLTDEFVSMPEQMVWISIPYTLR